MAESRRKILQSAFVEEETQRKLRFRAGRLFPSQHGGHSCRAQGPSAEVRSLWFPRVKNGGNGTWIQVYFAFPKSE